MDALSSEWQCNLHYQPGDRVAIKIGDALGVAAFECVQAHLSSSDNKAYPLLFSHSSVLNYLQPVENGNVYWKHYPRGFPRMPKK